LKHKNFLCPFNDKYSELKWCALLLSWSAAIGCLLQGQVPTALLMVPLGVVLLVLAVKTFQQVH